jgi:hypothetical protein
MSSKVEEDITRDIGAAEKVADTIRSAVFGSHGRRTIE